MDNKELEKLIREIIKAEVQQQLDDRIASIIQLTVNQTLSKIRLLEPVCYIR